MRIFRRKQKRKYKDIAPEDIFLDSSNLPSFDVYQFEGRLEKPIGRRTSHILLGVFVVFGVVFVAQAWNLQIRQGESFLSLSENNRLDHTVLFARRGVIVDRNGVVLASNSLPEETDEETFLPRKYIEAKGFAHVLGYVSYPKKDSSGFYFQEEIDGQDGVELTYNSLLAGSNGRKIVETTAVGDSLSESVVESPEDGRQLTLSIDSRIQERLYQALSDTSSDRGFVGGAGVIIDVTTGEVVALTSFPEYLPSVLTSGEDEEAINDQLNDKREPFLNRVTTGLYTPGSIIKPVIAVGALDRKIIDPSKQILSTGELVVPNPFDPDLPTVFKDWKAHGLVDMRQALAVSSNVYFFNIGGGFEDQKGIGISGIEKYARAFGIGKNVGIDLPSEAEGVIPSPQWKEINFPGDPWRVGDTYNTSIGQYGFQVTPLQIARAVATIANGGLLVTPHVRGVSEVTPRARIDVDPEALKIVREGMRQAVLEGTAKGLNVSFTDVVGKTGTAELGSTKQNVNSWVSGFFPYESPKYAFAVVMEEGPAGNVIGGVFVMRTLLDWMSVHTPEYFTSG